MSKIKIIRVRVTELEEMTLKSSAKLTGLPVSAWMRMLGLNEAKKQKRDAQKMSDSEVK